jgi:hypothetical protein
MLEYIGKIAGRKIVLVVDAGIAALRDCALALLSTLTLGYSTDRWHRYFARTAPLPANLRTNVEISHILGKANPYLLQDAIFALEA